MFLRHRLRQTGCMRNSQSICASTCDGCTCLGGLRAQTSIMRSLVCSRARVDSQESAGCASADSLASPSMFLD